MCHLSAECTGCCLKCDRQDCQGQACSQLSRDHDGQRWETWMHLVTGQLRHLQKYIPKELRRKYGISQTGRTNKDK